MLAVAAVVIIINAIIFLNVLTGFKLFASLDHSTYRASIWLEKQDKPCKFTGQCRFGNLIAFISLTVDRGWGGGTNGCYLLFFPITD